MMFIPNIVLIMKFMVLVGIIIIIQPQVKLMMAKKEPKKPVRR